MEWVCYAVGKLTGTSYVAGIIGTSTGTSTVMTNVYAGTQIECTSHSGGLSGDNANITLTSCYYDKVVNSASAETDYARTTDVMIYKPNFIEWKFGDVWSIIEGQTYPYLRKMEMPAKVRPSVNSLKARIVNSLNSNPVSGLTINIRRGSNTKTGDIVKSIKSGSDGTFSVSNLATGNYTLEIMGSGYVTSYVNYTVKNGENNAGDISVMPLVTGNKMTIVLNWGENPKDLDSHLTGSGIEEVYYSHKNSTGVQLDVDDTTSYGPETITIDFDKIPQGTYNYFVKWFSGSGTWATSEARVKVYLDNKLVGEYTPSSSLATSSNWNALSVDTKTRTVKVN